MLAYESFIRRAAEFNLPFMLKGSYVTRQYFADPADRLPNDLDWVYLNDLQNAEDAKIKFDEWLINITETNKNDGVKFRSFRENSFWRMIDYAMSDDFPTVNTDLLCWVNGEVFNSFALDISFNLDVDVPPVPLLYKPLRGEPFTAPQTVPLSLQIAWKIHQTLVRPRFKDIFDLTHLLRHPNFDDSMLSQTLQTLVNECAADNTDINRLKWLISGDLKSLFSNFTINYTWDCWRHDVKFKYNEQIVYDRAANITNADNTPSELPIFIEEFTTSLNYAGFNQTTLENLPLPKRQKRKGVEKPVQDYPTNPKHFWE